MKKKQAKQNKPTSNKNISSSTKLPAISNKLPPSANVSLNAQLNIASYQDEGLVTLIQEYLLKNNLFDTLETFQKDCVKGFKQSVKSIEALKKQLMTAFDSGNREAFFAGFGRYVPLAMRSRDNKTLKMEFYIQLYFYIYSIHPFLGKKKILDQNAKQGFVSYLQGRGSILSKQEQFLPFYALAYLPKPHEHQTFKSMFTKQWIQDLRKQLNVYIDKLYPAGKTPTIVNIYEKFIEYNLEAEKYSSVGLTEPDEDYDEVAIQEQIEQNNDDALLNNPQPVLLQNNNNGQSNNRFTNNNSMEKLNFYNQINNNVNNGQSPQPTLEKEEFLALNDRLNQMEEQRAGLLSYIENYKKKYQNLENDFKEFSESIKTILQESQNKWFRIIQELYNVAIDLLNAANNLEKGIPLADKTVLVKRGEKLERYRGFVSMNIQDLLSDNVADYSLFERPEHDLSVDMVKKNTEYLEREQKFIEIDFSKAKSVLGTPITPEMFQQDIKQLNLQKYLILQALRERLTRMRGAFQKRQVVLSYTLFDVLGINQTKEKGQKSIVNELLNSNNYSILLQTTLLISALCKDYYGRQYLFDQKLMIKMMDLRKSPTVDEKIKEIILIIFQLQSNKRSCQVVMIQNGLMQEIVQKLDKQRDQMDAFNMQYATALLLNLLLSKKGLDRAEGIKSQILMTLINLMEIQNDQVKNFVHASLYPLLARKTFRQKALEFGMEANIKYLLENSPSVDFEHQLKYVYNRLMMEHDEEQQKDDEPEYDQINDEEIGEDVPFINDQVVSALSGEFFLMKKYALTGPDAMQQMVQIKQEVKVTFSKAIYFERQTNQRYSVQTPLLGKGRKSQIQGEKGGFTHNHSVYSNKSSNRVLRSEKNSRIKMAGPVKSPQKQRLDTVLQNGSEASLKQFRQHSKGEYRNQRKIPNQIKEKKQLNKEKMNLVPKSDNVLEMDNAEGTFRQFSKEESPLKQSLMQDYNSIPINQSTKIIGAESMIKEQDAIMQRLNEQNEQEANLRNKKLKPYEQNEQYVSAFQTRARLVRTPPQKPS